MQIDTVVGANAEEGPMVVIPATVTEKAVSECCSLVSSNRTNPTVRGIQQLRKNSIQTIRDSVDVLRHIIQNVSSRLVGTSQSPAVVTKWENFFFPPKKGF
jgi:hypothetical protein